MKFIITGCTGFIGSEVLSQCLRNPTITSVVALSRRPLPDSVRNDPKLKTVILKDFNSYPGPVLKELAGADACIWYLFPSLLQSKEFGIKVASHQHFPGAWEILLEIEFWKLIIHSPSVMLFPELLRRSFGISISAEQQPRGIRRKHYGSKER